MTILAYTYSQVIFFNDDSFGLFNDIIKFVAAVTAYYAIIIESFLKRSTQSRIWNLLAQCHQANRVDGIDQCKLWNPAQFNCYFFGYVGLMILTDCYRMPFIFSKNQHLNYWPFLTILLILTRSRHMQYIFYLNIVKRQLHLLFEELRRIDEYSRYNRSKLEKTLQQTYDQFLCHRLYLAREYYSLIYEISIELNEAFGWSHLVNLTHSFVQILTDLYWCYWLSGNETYILSGDRRVFENKSNKMSNPPDKSEQANKLGLRMPKIRLQSSDGVILETDSAIAKCSDTIKRMLEDCGIEEEENTLIPVPNVRADILRKVLEFADHHKDDKEPVDDDENNANTQADEIPQWDENFLKVDQGTLFELVMAANFLNAKGLLDVTCKTVANMMRGKTPEEIRQTFNIQCDFDDDENERIRRENEWCEEK
ncbi:hypothetical protein HA402_005776 [Bradysia odoriphaga]|nr:hypothetical protein HA402_005776 [Bradysia odoriphaga]